MRLDKYINRFLRWYLTKTGRTCEHCWLYEPDKKRCQIFNCCWHPTDFCMRWGKKD